MELPELPLVWGSSEADLELSLLRVVLVNGLEHLRPREVQEGVPVDHVLPEENVTFVLAGFSQPVVEIGGALRFGERLFKCKSSLTIGLGFQIELHMPSMAFYVLVPGQT